MSSFGSSSFASKPFGLSGTYAVQYYDTGWTYVASDDFNRLPLNASLTTNLLVANSFGGYSASTWYGLSNAMFSDGNGKVGSNNPGANASVNLPGLTDTRTRIYFDPAGATSNMCVFIRSSTPGFSANDSIVGIVRNDHTSLTIRHFTGGSSVDRANISITPPVSAFWLELEIDTTTSTATVRILNSDFSVRNSTSAVLPTVPAGNYYGFAFYQSTATGYFDNFAVGEKVYVEKVTFKPLADILTTNWTATGAVFANQINEAVPESSTYIQSPNLLSNTDSAVFSLDGSMPIGSYQLKINGSKTLVVGKFRVLTLDSSNVVTGTSDWVTPTTSDSQYLFNITTTGVSDKFRVEVSQ